MEKIPGIYLIRNNISGTIYVGHASSTAQRKRQHKHRLRRGTCSNRYLQNSWNKYGESAFEFIHYETIHGGIKARRDREVEIILGFRAGNIPLFNCSTGGEGQPHTEEAKRKISIAHTGKLVSEETRKRMSVALKGIPCHPNTKAAISRTLKGVKRGPMSEETKRKVSLAKMGKPSHIWTEESRKKLSASQKGHPVSDEARKKMSIAQARIRAYGFHPARKLVTFNGQTMGIKQWAEEIGIERRALGYRLRNWTLERALEKPYKRQKTGPKKRIHG